LEVWVGRALALARGARASRVRIDLAHVPIHPDARRAAVQSGRAPLDHALHDGEDHELLATLDARALAGLRGVLAVHVIGRVRGGRGLWMQDERGRWVRWSDRGGWVHGRA
jgi:thiamine monophosphate kinase